VRRVEGREKRRPSQRPSEPGDPAAKGPSVAEFLDNVDVDFEGIRQEEGVSWRRGPHPQKKKNEEGNGGKI